MSFSTCGSAHRFTCIVDGDTLWLRGEKIRLAGIDAPELFSPGCRFEKAKAREATNRLRAILSSNGWQVVRRGSDRYGRTLANFWIGKTTAGQMLVHEGLAVRFGGGRPNWCRT